MNNHPHAIKKKNIFTRLRNKIFIGGPSLIEIMIIVCIIGILAAIAIPNFIQMQERQAENYIPVVPDKFEITVETNGETKTYHCDKYRTWTHEWVLYEDGESIIEIRPGQHTTITAKRIY